MPLRPGLSDFRACKFFAADPRVGNAGDGRENSASLNPSIPSHNYEKNPWPRSEPAMPAASARSSPGARPALRGTSSATPVGKSVSYSIRGGRSVPSATSACGEGGFLLERCKDFGDESGVVEQARRHSPFVRLELSRFHTSMSHQNQPPRGDRNRLTRP